MDKNTLITVINRDSGVVGYTIPDMNNFHRDFYPNESKQITFEQLEKLSFTPGGAMILKDFLEITDKEAANLLLHESPQPEYFYSKQDVKRIMQSGSLDEFLDCLDFAPEVIKSMIKELAVNMPLNDVAKRDAIKEKLGYDVSRVIEIKNTKYDGETKKADEAEASKNKIKTNGRRVEINNSTPTATGRRYVAPKKE